ncbi:MAG: 3-phosphoshikimate 1-carboxyvinyltransferase [Vulcanimicrobiaceae bacterium]
MLKHAPSFRPGPLRGRIAVPGDKSISHRALVVAASGRQPVRIANLNPGRDVRATIGALRALGTGIDDADGAFVVTGAPLHDPARDLDCMNSGSTARMLMGVCAGAALTARLDGDASLRGRPMEPVAAQLRAFGARIETEEGKLPALLQGTAAPQTRRFILLSPSAQVKSALLFCGLYGGVPVAVTGDAGSRDHTERLLRYFGADIEFDRRSVELRGGPTRYPDIEVAGDFSAAAFFIVAATISPGSSIVVENVGVNPSRTGLLDALLAMGADVRLLKARERCGEPIADIAVTYAPLQAISVGRELALRAIDEIPVLAVAAAFAPGTTSISGICDLRTKESNRIAAIERMLAAVGIAVTEMPDGIAIAGGNPRPVEAALVETRDDHRTAMSVAALAAGAGPLAIDAAESIDVSFPSFLTQLQRAQA